MKQEDITKKLFNELPEINKADFSKYLFEQYKLYVESIERVSDRRLKTNEFFLAINTATIAAIGFAFGKGGNNIPPLFYILSALGGISICYLWYGIIRSYKGLNSGKLKMIHAIETKLPLSLYDTEWDVLGRGNDKSKYWPFSHIELNIPWAFIIFHSFILLKFLIPILILIYPILMGPIK